MTKNKKATPTEFYSLEFRIVRFSASEDKDVTVVTNLAQSSYPAWKLKELYHLHLGIETAFRSLKHTLGLSNFHAKK
ncbi:transposase [Ligilactobacillus murinus]|uniref:transposase n=1 Tax=Ligilactobacillus murinus TaxID=1622 RepID=UPI001CDACAB9